jgi:uncharacterized protein YndB with AHSA1/START domain
MSNTITLHRVLKAPVSRVFRAFVNPDALATWIPPFGFIAKVHEFNAVVGGSHRMSFINFTNQKEHTFGGTYYEIKTDELLKYGDKFDDVNLSGEMIVTITFKAVFCGTELSIKQEGIPSVIPPEMCDLGWQESLIKLAQLVEPEINE